MKTFLVKAFHLNVVSKIKCILKVFTFTGQNRGLQRMENNRNRKVFFRSLLAYAVIDVWSVRSEIPKCSLKLK